MSYILHTEEGGGGIKAVRALCILAQNRPQIYSQYKRRQRNLLEICQEKTSTTHYYLSGSKQKTEVTLDFHYIT